MRLRQNSWTRIGNVLWKLYVLGSTFAFTDAEFWKTGAQSTLRLKLARPLQTGRAKNVILFLGDGLSIPTLAAARTYLGQSQGHTGEETVLSFEAFPHTGLSKVIAKS
jgi:alkaline phosphatase